MPDIEDKLVAKAVIKSQWATAEQVRECWEFQNQERQNGRTPLSLLNLLLEKNYISTTQKESLVKKINKKNARLFGEIAIDLKLITRVQLQECLDIQDRVKKSGQEDLLGFPPYLGEILVSKNYIDPEAIDRILEEQNNKEIAIKAGDKKREEFKESVTCKHCGAQFNMKLMGSSKKLKCGQCGQSLLSESTVKKEPVNLVQKITLSLPKFGRARGKKATLPGYQIIETLGEDFTGITYRACKEGDKNQLAIKVFNEEAGNDEKFIGQLKKMVQRQESLHIPNIRRCLSVDSYEAEGRHITYLVSEFIEGKSLRQVLHQGTPISTEKALTITTRIAKILQYAYEDGLFHGDVALHNILISKEGKVIVANLGIPNKTINNLFRIAEMDGIAPLYIPPELLDENKQCDQRSDIYCLGSVLYQLLAKRPPFQGTSPFEVLSRINENTPLPPIRVYNSDVSSNISDIIEKMMEPDIEKRYQTYYELIAHLHDPQQAHITKVAETVVPQDTQPEAETEPQPIEQPQEAFDTREQQASETLARISAPTEESRRNEEESSLRQLSQHKDEIPWQKIVTAAAFLLIIGIPVYLSMAKAQQIEQAKKAYFTLREEVSRQKKNIDKAESLEKKMRTCADMEKRLRAYKIIYKDVPFSKDSNMLQNVDTHLKDLEKFQNQILNKAIQSVFTRADVFLKKNYICAALETLTLDTIPQGSRTNTLSDQINRKKEDILNYARQLVAKTTQQAEQNIKLLTTARAENKVVQEPMDQLKKAIETLEKYRQTFVEEAQNKSEIASILENTVQSIGTFKQKLDEYNLWAQEERQKKSQSNLQGLLAKTKPYLDQYDYNQASKALQQGSKDKQLSAEDLAQIQTIQDQIQNLKGAKETLIRHLSRLNTKNIKIYYQNKSYTLEAVTEKEFSFKPNQKVPWSKFPLEYFPMLIEFIMQYTTGEERVYLSSFCEESQNYALAYKLLRETATQQPIAKIKLENLQKKIQTDVEELSQQLRRNDWDKEWEKSLGSALALKNQYLVPGIPLGENTERNFNEFCQAAFYKLFGSETRQQHLFDFKGLDNHIAPDLLLQATAKIDNDYLWFGGGSFSFTEKNIRGVAGLCRFSKENEKLELNFGNYRFGIEATGKLSYYVFSPAKFQTVDIGKLSNKWIFFGLFIADNHAHWYINSKKQFSFPHPYQITIDKLTFKATSSKEGGVLLDNLYLGSESK